MKRNVENASEKKEKKTEMKLQYTEINYLKNIYTKLLRGIEQITYTEFGAF